MPADFNVESFRSALIYDGARPNLFRVFCNFPNVVGGLAALNKATFMVKSASLPGSSIGTATQYYMGRELKLAGDRSFDPWNITVINDEDFVLRNAFESWLNLMKSHKSNIRDPNFVTFASYTADWTVQQMGKSGDVIKSYVFRSSFPTDVSPIDLDWGSNDTIEEFSVTLNYQYWESLPTALSPVSTTT